MHKPAITTIKNMLYYNYQRKLMNCLKFNPKKLNNGKQLKFIIFLIILTLFVSSCAKPEAKVYHVGVLCGLDYFKNIVTSYKAEMQTNGYVEGKNIVYDIQYTNFEPEKERKIISSFAENKINLILAFPTEVAALAKEMTKDTGIPVIFATTITEDTKIINSIKEPGMNISGVRYPGPEIALKRLEIFYRLMPTAKKIWIPYQKDYPSVAPEMAEIRKKAESLGITLIEFPAENITELEKELNNREATDNFDFEAVFFIPESLSTTKAVFDLISDHTRKRQIPIVGSKVVTDDHGTLFGVTVDNNDFGKLASYLTNKVFLGIPAGNLPVISPEPYIIINMKVAKEFNIEIPEGLLVQANEIIK